MEKFKYFESKLLRDIECPCGALIRVGQAAGFRVRLDPQPITPAEEIAELQARRPTYELYETVLGAEPIYRSYSQIKSQTGRTVLATHRCERTLF
jgi:hypothetical protein